MMEDSFTFAYIFAGMLGAALGLIIGGCWSFSNGYNCGYKLGKMHGYEDGLRGRISDVE